VGEPGCTAGVDACRRQLRTHVTQRFTPPGTEVRDVAPRTQTSFSKVFATVLVASTVALLLSWVLAPLLAEALAVSLGHEVEPPGAAMLAFDLLLSAAAFVACAYAAARICHGRELLAIIAVCLVGWAVFFYEVGGLSGMLGAGFPLWYEFFPSHVIAALIALWLVRRRES
jgi:hypothetical protein